MNIDASIIEYVFLDRVATVTEASVQCVRNWQGTVVDAYIHVYDVILAYDKWTTHVVYRLSKMRRLLSMKCV